MVFGMHIELKYVCRNGILDGLKKTVHQVLFPAATVAIRFRRCHPSHPLS